MVIQKVKNSWLIGKKHISLYELYLVFGTSPEFLSMFGKVRPSEFTVTHVKAFVDAKKNKTGIFRDKIILSEKEVFSKFSNI